MTTGMIVFWVVVGLLVVWGLWVFIKNDDELVKAIIQPNLEEPQSNAAPYKLEPPNASDLVAVSEQPKKRGRPVGSKGGYTKRSAYWTDTRKRAAAKKARQAKIKAARAKARAAVGR